MYNQRNVSFVLKPKNSFIDGAIVKNITDGDSVLFL